MNAGTQKRRIGLLGGSFNPAHEGHVHISLEAMKRLRLHEVWWLVAPQNPLKSASDMADFDTRYAHACALARPHPRTRVCDFEQRHGLRYTADTIRLLQRAFPQVQFFWLMGADNLIQFHRWRRWQDIATRLPIVVLDRAPYSHSALRARTAIALRHCRLSLTAMGRLSNPRLPCWSYGFIARHPQSATALRFALGKDAFLRHN